MSKTAIIVANGCEEGETLTIVDILRRSEIPCDMIGIESDEITGAQGITMKTDLVLDAPLSDYDMVILPGGYGGVEAMMESEMLVDMLRKMNDTGKYIAAICAAPLLLDSIGLLDGKKYTCYPSVTAKISSGTRKDDKIVIDENLITSQGPATPYPFAFQILEALGVDPAPMKVRLLYGLAGGKEAK